MRCEHLKPEFKPEELAVLHEIVALGLGTCKLPADRKIMSMLDKIGYLPDQLLPSQVNAKIAEDL